MPLTRRKFLRAGAHAALVAALPITSLQTIYAQEEKQQVPFRPLKVDGLYQVPQEAKASAPSSSRRPRSTRTSTRTSRRGPACS